MMIVLKSVKLIVTSLISQMVNISLHSLLYLARLVQTWAIFRRRRRLIPGLRFDYLTFSMRPMAQRTSFGISIKRASRVLQFKTTIIKSNWPHLLLKQTARPGPACGVTPVFIPEYVPIESSFHNMKLVFVHL